METINPEAIRSNTAGTSTELKLKAARALYHPPPLQQQPKRTNQRLPPPPLINDSSDTDIEPSVAGEDADDEFEVVRSEVDGKALEEGRVPASSSNLIRKGMLNLLRFTLYTRHPLKMGLFVLAIAFTLSGFFISLVLKTGPCYRDGADPGIRLETIVFSDTLCVFMIWLIARIITSTCVRQVRPTFYIVAMSLWVFVNVIFLVIDVVVFLSVLPDCGNPPLTKAALSMVSIKTILFCMWYATTIVHVPIV